MNAAPDLAFWWRFGATLGLELTLIVLAAFAMERFMRSAMWTRTIWHVCLLGVIAVTVLEVTGAAHAVVSWLAAPKPQPSPTLALTCEAQPPSMFVPMDTPTPVGVPEPTLTLFAPPPPPPVVTLLVPPIVMPEPQPLLQPTHSWWPGIMWFAGFGLLISRMILVRILFVSARRGRKSLSVPELRERVDALALRLGIRSPMRVVEIARLKGPITYAVFRPTIGLPPDFAVTFSSKQQEVILIHELAHVAARDAVWYALADGMTALLWWHPMVWWTRRRLHAATETAADEACLAIKDGPSVLAQSLVQLGARLLEPQRLGLLGIEGFRSGLGRRVERLMKLDGKTWRPPSRIRSWMVKFAGPLLLVAGTIASVAWTMPSDRGGQDGWKDSVAGHALSALVSHDESRESVQADSDRVAALIGDGKIFFEAGKLDHAEGLFEEALKLDPANKEALRWLDEIAAARRAAQVNDPPEISEAKPKELERILPRDGQAARSFVGTQSVGAVSPVHSKVAAEHNPAPERKPPDVSRLHTKWWQIDPSALARNLKEMGYPSDGSFFGPPLIESHLLVRPSRDANLNPLTTVLDELEQSRQSARYVVFQPALESAYDGVRQFLQNAGVDLAPPKAIFLSGQGSRLMVRATLDDLNIVEQSMLVLNREPTQVTVEVKVADLTQTDFRALGLDWFLGRTLTNSVEMGRQSGSKPSNTPPAMSSVRLFPALQDTLDERYVVPKLPPAAAILTEDQFRLVVRALEQRQGVDLLAAPKVTTLSGRQVQTSIPAVEFQRGPVVRIPVHRMAVVPYVSADGHSIRLTTTPEGRDPISANVLDRETVMISIGPVQQIRGKDEPVTKERIVFVTATIIDPAGNPVHPQKSLDEQFPPALQVVPPPWLQRDRLNRLP